MGISQSIKNNPVVAFLSSVRVAIILLALAAIATLVGSILPQEVTFSLEDLVKIYAGPGYDFLDALGLDTGFARYKFMHAIGLSNVFFSTWYLFLMLVFYVSIVLASFIRVFPAAKTAFNFAKLPGLTDKLPLQLNLGKISPDLLKNFFKKNFYSLKEDLDHKSQDKKLLFSGLRGAYHRLGATFTHIGIIAIMTGATWGMLTGFGGFQLMSPGEQVELRKAEIKRVKYLWFGNVPDVSVKVLNTWREDYENGFPKQYYSDLELYDNKGELLQRHMLKVNQPLKYKDFYIYQNSFGEYIQVEFNGKAIDIGLQKTGLNDSAILEISKEFFLKMEPQSLPAGEALAVYAGNSQVEDSLKMIGVIFKGDEMNIGSDKQIINFKFNGVFRVTGLQYKSNPGQALLILGFIILIFGVFIAFGSKKQIWVTQDKNSGDIIVFGTANKLASQFAKDLSQKLEKHVLSINS